MKLEIFVDSPNSDLLKTTDVKVFLNGKQLGWLNEIEFKANIKEFFCSLILKTNSKTIKYEV